MRRRPAKTVAPPLDLRFIDLFMAIVLVLAFIAIMLTVVASVLPSDAPSRPAARQETARQIAELEKERDAAVAAQRRAEAELRATRASIAERATFALPWWLIGLCALLGVLVVYLDWRIRLWRRGNLPRLRTWLLVTGVVAVVTWALRSRSDSDGYLLLAEIPWWAAEALCLGLLLVAYVLITQIRAGRRTLAEIRSR
ncbi:MAG TPA: hypothetical protein VKZ82_23655 [Nonomuraea sp.]|uniref:hypothetical protein n=1 Tax=Nonomuraea sp. NPDC049649 TaxID=3155776 RepID=UPI002C17606F|nr:hypothetical protein [Nonomuraea sp.]